MAKIIEHMPMYMRPSKVAKNITHPIDIENASTDDLIAEMVAQFIVSTATYTLPRWEEQYGLDVNPQGITIDERRSRIKAKMRSVGVVNKAMIQNVVNAWTNADIEVIEQFDQYKVVIKFVNQIGIPTNIQDVYNAIDEIIPAHIQVAYEFKYRRYEELESKTHAQLSAFTHQTIREGVI